MRLRSSKGAHFGAFLERFSEGEGSSNSDDAPSAVRARIRKGKAIARDEDKIDDIRESNREQQQQAGPGTVAQAHDAAAIHWSPHCTMHTPFVYAPDLIVPAHPFGIYAPSTAPDPPPGCSTLPYHAADADEQDEDLMPAEMGDEAPEAELRTEAPLDEVDVRAAAAYEAGVWCELRRGGGQGATGDGPSQRARKRRAGAEMDRDGAHSMRLWKRRKGVFGVGGYVPVPLAAFEEQDGVRVKSAAMIEDSDSG